MYLWILNGFGFYGWLVCLIFVVACCLRLARFNLDISEKIEKNNWKINFFTGVPAPAAAGLALLPMIISFSNFNQVLQIEPIVILVIVVLVSFLMISKIPTYAVKQIRISRSVFILIALSTVLFFGFLFKNTFETLTVIGFVYLFSIPVSLIHYLNLKKNMKNKTAIISLSDEKYFHLLNELIESIKSFHQK